MNKTTENIVHILSKATAEAQVMKHDFADGEPFINYANALALVAASVKQNLTKDEAADFDKIISSAPDEHVSDILLNDSQKAIGL